MFHQYTIQIDPFYTSNKNIQDVLKRLIFLQLSTTLFLFTFRMGTTFSTKSEIFHEKLSKTVLSLPMHTELSMEEQKYIAPLKAIKKWI